MEAIDAYAGMTNFQAVSEGEDSHEETVKDRQGVLSGFWAGVKHLASGSGSSADKMVKCFDKGLELIKDTSTKHRYCFAATLVLASTFHPISVLVGVLGASALVGVLEPIFHTPNESDTAS